MDPSESKKGNAVRDTTKEVRNMGAVLLAIGLVVLAAGLAAWYRHNGASGTAHYLIMAIFGGGVCAAGLYTWKNAKPKD